jgi:hypothetical protein
MPVVVFSYYKDVQKISTSSNANILELTCDLDVPPGLRRWTLVDLQYMAATKVDGTDPTDPTDDIAFSCLLYPDFLSRRSTSRMIEVANTTPAVLPVFRYTQSNPLYVRRYGSLTSYIDPNGSQENRLVVSSSSFNPIDFGVLNINTNLISLRFRGENLEPIATGVLGGTHGTSSIVKFDAVFTYE